MQRNPKLDTPVAPNYNELSNDEMIAVQGRGLANARFARKTDHRNLRWKYSQVCKYISPSRKHYPQVFSFVGLSKNQRIGTISRITAIVAKRLTQGGSLVCGYVGTNTGVLCAVNELYVEYMI